MSIDPGQPEFAPQPSPPTLPVAAASASSPPAQSSPTQPLPAEPPPFVPMPPPLPQPAPPAAPKPWGFWATLGWGAIILLVNNMAATLVILLFWTVMLFRGQGGLDGADPVAYLKASVELATAKGLCPATIFATVVSVPMIVLLIRARHLPVLEYLAVTRIRVIPFVVSFALLAALVFGLGFLYSKAGWQIGGGEMEDMFRACPSKALLLITLVICAPVFEEFLFRGFLFRGIAAKAGPLVAILLPSVIFASLHVQYTIWGMLYVLCLGLLFGAVRWRTGSISITMLLHATVNFVGFLEILHYLK